MFIVGAMDGNAWWGRVAVVVDDDEVGGGVSGLGVVVDQCCNCGWDCGCGLGAILIVR